MIFSELPTNMWPFCRTEVTQSKASRPGSGELNLSTTCNYSIRFYYGSQHFDMIIASVSKVIQLVWFFSILIFYCRFPQRYIFVIICLAIQCKLFIMQRLYSPFHICISFSKFWPFGISVYAFYLSSPFRYIYFF